MAAGTTQQERMAERLRAVGSPVLCASHVSKGTPGEYLIRPHLVMIDRAVRRAIATGRYLVIEMPPRHGKSLTVSQYLPFWFLGTWPEKRVILASYESSFAAGWGGKARDLMDAHGERLWGLRTKDDSRSKSEWGIEGHLGGMMTAGVGGAITGKGADLFIVDDPVKNQEEAMSSTYRKKAWDWWLSTARTRIEPGGIAILMATRWHKEDLLGEFMAKSNDEYDELRLPALAEEGDPLDRGAVTCPHCGGTGRDPKGPPDASAIEAEACPACNGAGLVGEALWPERYDEGALVKRQLDSFYWFTAMYQGTPRPLAGGIFDPQHRRYYQRPPDGAYLLANGTRLEDRQLRKFATIDVAASEKQSADYTVVSTWGWAALTGDLLLLDVVRLQQATPKHRKLVRDAYAKHKHAAIGIEKATYGLALLQELRRSGLPLRELDADKDKVTRALMAAALYERHALHHPAQAPWLKDFEDELDAFPNGAHDDQVDTAGYAAQMVAEWATVRAPGEPVVEADRIPADAGYDMAL